MSLISINRGELVLSSCPETRGVLGFLLIFVVVNDQTIEGKHQGV